MTEFFLIKFVKESFIDSLDYVNTSTKKNK